MQIFCMVDSVSSKKACEMTGLKCLIDSLLSTTFVMLPISSVGGCSKSIEGSVRNSMNKVQVMPLPVINSDVE